MRLAQKSLGFKLFLGFGLLLALMMTKGSSTASAYDCGVRTGNMGSLAGAIIIPIWRDDSGNDQVIGNVSTNVRVEFRTKGETLNGKTYPAGGDYNKIQKTNGNANTSGEKVSSAWFDVIPGCALAKAAVLGYDTTSSNVYTSPKAGDPYNGSRRWALDCDESIHGDGYGQRFDVTGSGVPPGARPGGTWETITIRSNNGFTVSSFLRYTQGPKLYNVNSTLVNNQNRSLNMPDKQAGVEYGSNNNATHKIINGYQGVENTNHYQQRDGVYRNFVTEVTVPSVIIVNGVRWTLQGSRQCQSNCRADGPGGQNQTNPRNIAANTIPEDSTIRVFWYYEPDTSPPPTPGCELRVGLGTIPSGGSDTLTWSTTNNPTSLVISPGLSVPTPVGGGSVSVSPGATTTYYGYLNGSTTPSCDVTVIVQNPPDRPYFKITGNDAQAGSAFDNNNNRQCSDEPPSDPNASFKGFNVNLSPYNGSGAQFALLALGVIQNVSSSNLKIPVTSPSRETIANLGAGAYGGSSGLTRCIPDYLYTNPNTPNNVPSTTVIPATTLSGNDKRTIYLNGNVIINGDITYEVRSGDLPNYTLIVDGNIYVTTNVRRLDGLYVAQNKRDSNTGLIYTCTDSNGAIPRQSNVFALCNNRLIVNGSLVARQINPWRLQGSVSNLSGAAEEFNFSPDLYMNPIRANDSDSSYRYDSINTVAPIF